MNRLSLALKATPALTLSAVLLASLAACGGGSSSDPAAQAESASGTETVQTTGATDGTAPLDASTAATIAGTTVLPQYHLSPVLLDEPDQSDVGGTNASARQPLKSFEVDADVASQSTVRLSREALADRIARATKARVASVSSAGTTPQTATSITTTVFTPAQLRAAYNLPALPVSGASLTAAQAASYGAGQTIYVLDAYHDATALSDLNAFSSKFGVPGCTSVGVATSAAMPLAAPPSGCTFSQVYATSTGTMTATAPAYNAGWAPESKLDVQWAHAVAPLARIVLIEMPDTMTGSIHGALALATKMGPGVVSMSFGSTEASWAPAVDSYFTGNGMTFVASAGDAGSQVLWPAVSANVLAVGGTATNYSATTGLRTETAWASTGGGMSAYEPVPAWQSGLAPAGGSAVAHRALPDVSFNASTTTGQYVALTLPGATTVWNAYGGTSIAAPQWAAIVAVANAIRVSNAKALLGDIHTALYKSIAAVPGIYAGAFGDVNTGANGTCATCKAGTGFDLVTGWGTPNATSLLTALTGVSTTTSKPAAVVAPTVPGGAYAARVGTALSQSLSITAPAGTTTSYALSGAPAGTSVDTTGTLKWAAPVAGSYSFVAKATTATGASASGTYSLKVIPGTAPVISGGSFSAKAGVAFAASLGATNPNGGTLAYSVTGAPAGLVITSAGQLSWAAPVAGTHSFAAKVTDSYGYSGTATVTLTVAAAASSGPTLTSATYTTTAGAYFTTMLYAKNVAAGTISYTMSGAPSGLLLSGSGNLHWGAAVKGNYTIIVTVRDSTGAAGSATIKLIVS